MKLQENSYKISFKALLVNIQQSKTNKKRLRLCPYRDADKVKLGF